MKVIAAGFPKTGTKSVCTALRILGYTVYDFEENATYLADEWAQVLHHGWTTEHFRNMYKDIDAVTDFPACCFWEEIYKAFPDSKIILMIRDDEESWFMSAANQIRESESKIIARLFTWISPTGSRMMVNFKNYGRIAFGINDSFLWKPFSLSYLNEQLMKLKYRAHNAYVLQNAPPEKLLVFKCSEGWEPLCKFLDVPMPDLPFPHKNKGATLTNEILEGNPFVQKMKKEVQIALFVIVICTAIVVYFFFIS